MKNDDSTYRYYLNDLEFLVKEKIEELKKNPITPNDDYAAGYKQGIYEMVTMIKHQAVAFQIDLKYLQDIDPDTDLLT